MPFIDKRKNAVRVKGIKVPSQAQSVWDLCETRRQLDMTVWSSEAV